MSESQSRYSIVERLTRSKLDIMDASNHLDMEIISKEQELQKAEKDLIDWEANIKEDIPRAKKQKQRDIDNTLNQVNIAKNRKAEKQRHYEQKIAELDKALKAIEDISKTAPTPQDQA